MSVIQVQNRIRSQPNDDNTWVILPDDLPIDFNRPWITFSPGMDPIKLKALLALLSVKVADGELCTDCGSIMIRTGACFTCPSCGKAGGCG